VRRSLSIFLLVLAPLAAPTGIYELLQKSSERSLAPPVAWFALSERAELETPWRPHTGLWFVDHAQHELQETRRFLMLVGESI